MPGTPRLPAVARFVRGPCAALELVNSWKLRGQPSELELAATHPPRLHHDPATSFPRWRLRLRISSDLKRERAGACDGGFHKNPMRQRRSVAQERGAAQTAGRPSVAPVAGSGNHATTCAQTAVRPSVAPVAGSGDLATTCRALLWHASPDRDTRPTEGLTFRARGFPCIVVARVSRP
jgi:hypothetical protein